ncbi:hypothetical protein ACH5RR_012281 [Cinchona calisaya]|uniref:Uncharacterized protein n=1 Tax=Cinchona calisaya TaxID=153742 RepID=A0ABD3AAY3_9GENT
MMIGNAKSKQTLEREGVLPNSNGDLENRSHIAIEPQRIHNFQNIPNRDRPTWLLYIPSLMRNGHSSYWRKYDGTTDETGSYIDHDEEVWDQSPGHRRNTRDDLRADLNCKNQFGEEKKEATEVEKNPLQHMMRVNVVISNCPLAIKLELRRNKKKDLGTLIPSNKGVRMGTNVIIVIPTWNRNRDEAKVIKADMKPFVVGVHTADAVYYYGNISPHRIVKNKLDKKPEAAKMMLPTVVKG